MTKHTDQPALDPRAARVAARAAVPVLLARVERHLELECEDVRAIVALQMFDSAVPW